ncbi:MAG: threonine ammonia-lyase [Deltaproteobacteria bacterium RBG_13_52_11b]|nr:MAG: threonine ammonia-lyase [Deltaproteobacteria bacterium RBG_13_52_11b]
MKLWEKIESAEKRIRNAIFQTPMVCSDTLSTLTGHEVFLKLENLQKGGSFKIRGAYNKVSQLSTAARRRGVVTASAGNHAQGVAIASSLLGIPSTIVMPEGASIAKQMATRSYGGNVILFGQNTDEALEYAKKLEEDGKAFIHPFDDEQVVAGQGTIGLEILEEVPDVDGIIVPVGGGGLISGIATLVKEKQPRVKIVGVQSINAPAGFISLKQKKIVEVKVKPTLADGIALRKIGEITFPIIQRNVDEIVTVDEEEIASAILMLMERKRVVAEGAGAAPLAALLAKRTKTRLKKVVLVISGGNIDVNLLDRIIEKGLSQTGRMVRLGVFLRDVPGSLARLSHLVAEHRANILHIVHERADRDIPIGFSRVVLVLETRGPQHIREIQKGLKRNGYVLQVRSLRNASFL